MKCLTVHNYWAWAIAAGHKTVENRPRTFTYRGPLAIHAGVSRRSLADSANVLRSLGIEPPPLDQLAFGAIVAVCELVDVVELSAELTDPLATGPYCLMLANVVRLPKPLPWTGNQGLFEVPFTTAGLLATR